MSILVIGVLLFFFILIIVDKKKDQHNHPTIQEKKPTKILSLDEKIALEKAESIQKITSLITQVEKQGIEQLIAVLNRAQENKQV
ncbi:hypothetical protein ATZ33_00745 [Enterococcus silesiacus]|uniref:Uncharacterized protein n=1 Tax=Enterococcus silesiacus TaxID=332949 RepID=A0A0S3K6U9_9ENTE|nr:hypothetical protein [Enterococcus silesiacus]ALR99959.1 hypothetical protein ATZ33_00745 [Enterococcus silesiacus]OJG92733.1 hypothetical protein RV15_GL002678 [Enterococcus silesiacus]